jgi:hypothetical protein
MAAPNFELITELQTCTRRDFPLTDPTILNPVNANPIIDGEWLELASTYTLGRGSTSAGTASTNPLQFPVHTERGRYDTQAIGKVNVIMLGMYEAETAVHYGATDTYSIGDPLCVSAVTIGGIAGRRGLMKDSSTSGRVYFGFVSKVTGSGATARVRFVHFGNQKM